MKIAVFRTNTILASWTTWAIPATLRAMGHEVLAAALPGSLGNLQVSQGEYSAITREMPTIEQLRTCDAVLVVGPEVQPVALGTRRSFADMGQTVGEYFGLPALAAGTSFLHDLVTA